MKHQRYQHPEKANIHVETDPAFFNLDFIHQFLSEESYWADGTDQSETIEKIESELCFGLFDLKQQIGFASVTSDGFSFAYISDVFITNVQRGNGYAVWLMTCILKHPFIKDLSSWMLLTTDAHGLYEKIGFSRVEGSPDQMIKYNT